MAHYDALIAKWATLTGTTAQKLAAIQALMVTLPGQRMIIPSYDIYNCLEVAEFNALSAANQTLVRDLVGMGQVDASLGKPARTRLLALFGAGTTTRANLVALAATYDAPTIPWWQATVAQGGGGLTSQVSSADLAAAGGLS